MRGMVIVALALLIAGEAAADVALVGPSGRSQKRVQRELTLILAEIDRVVSEAKLMSGGRPPKRDQLTSWLVARAEERGARIVIAELKGQRLRLVVNGAEETFRIGTGRFSSELRSAIAEFLERALSETSIEAAPAEVVEAQPEPRVQPEVEPHAPLRIETIGAPASASVGAGLLARALRTEEGAPALLRLAIGMAGISRWFDYNDPFTGNLRPHQIYFMPAPTAAVELHPLAFVRMAALSGIGLRFGLAHSIGATSARAGGPSLPTTYSTLSAGIAYRIALTGGSAPILLVPELGYERTALSLGESDDGQRDGDLPDVAYSALSAGSRFELPIAGGFELILSASFLEVFSAGEIISADFHRGGARGVSAGLGARLRLPASFAIEASASYQRFFFAFDPEPGDRVIAGGALDQYLTARASISVEL